MYYPLNHIFDIITSCIATALPGVFNSKWKLRPSIRPINSMMSGAARRSTRSALREELGDSIGRLASSSHDADRQEMITAIRTFRPDNWTHRLAALTPIDCIARGWSVVAGARNQLQCRSCARQLHVKIAACLDEQGVTAVIESIRDRMSSRHHDTCRYYAASDHAARPSRPVIRLLSSHPEEILQQFNDRLRSLEEMMSSTSSVQLSTIPAPFMQSRSSTMRTKAAIAAACGWQSSVNMINVISCALCDRSVPIANSIRKRSSSLSLSSAMKRRRINDESCVDDGAEAVVGPIFSIGGIRVRSVTASPLPGRDLFGSALPISVVSGRDHGAGADRPRVIKVDVIDDHAFYCPWRDGWQRCLQVVSRRFMEDEDAGYTRMLMMTGDTDSMIIDDHLPSVEEVCKRALRARRRLSTL